MNTSQAEWAGIIETLEETLEDVLSDLRRARAEGIQSDITALELFDQLDHYLSGIKRDMGI